MKILICGVGAIGSNLARLLAVDLKGEHEITILDKDHVEERNVTPGTQCYTPEQVGLSKVEALQYNIYKWHQREVQIRHEELKTGAGLNYEFDLVIDCFDNSSSRKFLHQSWMVSSSVSPTLHLGFSDQFTYAIEWSTLEWQVPSDITSGMDICEMPGAASFVVSVASLGALVVQEYLRKQRKLEFVGSGFSRTIIA